jgi:adenylate cyclase
MFTDIVGYTALSQKNEALAMQLLEEHRRRIRPFFQERNGREVKTIGDAFLVEFASALDAVRCAFDIQQSMHEMNSGRPEEKRVLMRIGIHVGDVIHSQGDVYGDSVNVASRIEPLALPGGICVSEQVYDQVKNKLEFPLASLGEKELKNVSEPTEVFRIVLPWEEEGEEKSTADGHRIAILPFANFSPDPNDEYFADGITEEVISTVSGISGISVISRTSVMGYKGTSKKVGEIGRELGVGSVLEGSFRKAGNRIRVTTQLIDVVKDRHLWAQSYDRELDDVFAVQSDVARQVADALRVRVLSPEKERLERKPTESTAAYSLYLKGRFLWNKRTREGFITGRECFEQAVSEDPRFALGYAGVADCCLGLRQWNIDLEANLNRARAMVAKALEIDPGLAEAHTTKGLTLLFEYNVRQAEDEFKRAIELKPSHATAHQWYMWALLPQLRWDEAREQIEKAVELDPLSPIINHNHGYFYYSMREYAKAIEPYRRAVELGLKSAHGDVASAYGRMKMFDEMRREAAAYGELLQESFPFAREAASMMCAFREGDRQAIERSLPALEAHFQDAGFSAYVVAMFHFFLGANDKGFEWLERSYSRAEDSLIGITYDPDFDGIRADPRYLELVKRLGLA